MALTPGTRLGPYEIVGSLGAGGMGEVYRARDTRLGREVAAKVLPRHLTASPEERARFQREAKVISSLNHPHICVLHDIGQEGDTDFLVMELIDGETLADRISRGPMPTEDVLRIGSQLAAALDRAHRAGVIHRDLKPSNVMLTKSGAKLMDFGLARSATALSRGGDDVTATAHAGAPNSGEPITAKGTIVGTFQYMAPEQLEGSHVDARSDVWALGCVLYEMATGRRAFDGSTPASVISAIMRDQPRVMAELAPLTPPALERSVKQCIAKAPEDRWQTAADLGRELQWIAEAGSQTAVTAPITARSKIRERVAWALAVGVLAALATMLLQPKHSPKSVAFELATPRHLSVDQPSISPDGMILAFNATDSSDVSSIWVRRLNSLEAKRLPGTEGAGRPFWSPDSRYLAYFAERKLMKIDIGGGLPVELCEARSGGDGTWGRGGVILFDGVASDSIQRVSAAGGIPTGATRLDRSKQETGTAWPHFLPDGRHFLYIAYGQDPDSSTLKVGSVDSEETLTLGPARSRAEYASGYLLYVSGTTLIGRPFDSRSFKYTGEPVAIVENVEADRGGGARFSTSSEGTLVVRSGVVPAATRMVWIDRRGRRIGTVGPEGNYDMPALSPDGAQLAVQVTDPLRSTSEMWLWDLARNLGSRFTFTDRAVLHPAWSPDGTRLVYGRERGTGFDVVVKPVAGAGAESLLYASDETKDVSDWSADGRWILYMAASTTTNVDILALSTTESRPPVPIVTSRFLDVHPALSPDGKWLVYASLESGQWEVYVQSFLAPGGRWRISTNGGIQSFWRQDGREIFYLALDGGLMSVTVQPGTPPSFSLPRKLFDSPAKLRFNTRNQYVPAADGQRFMFVAPEGEAEVGATTVMLNWPALLPMK